MAGAEFQQQPFIQNNVARSTKQFRRFELFGCQRFDWVELCGLPGRGQCRYDPDDHGHNDDADTVIPGRLENRVVNRTGNGAVNT